MTSPRAVLAVVASLGLVGCSATTNGTPTVDVTRSSTSEPTTSQRGATGTASLAPCTLLARTEQAALDLGPGLPDDIGLARSCQWQASGRYTVTVGVFDTLGINQVRSNGATTPMSIGAHGAVRYSGGLSSCGIAIGVTRDSRVDVVGTAGGDVSRACTVARRAAALVEPKLP